MQNVTHQYASVDGIELFYREAGFAQHPTVLLLHGSPSSSIQFRHILHNLSDQWHLIAPDLPPFGFTEFRGNPQFSFSFDNLAGAITRFIEKLRLQISAIYLHDYGAQVGFRLLTSGVISPRCLIIQNSEAYHGVGWRAPMWAIEKRLSDPPESARQTLLQGLLKEEGVRREFLEDLPSKIALRIDPASIELAWSKIDKAEVRDSLLNLLMDYGSNMKHYGKVQACLRAGSLPTLLLWGELDQYLSPEAGHAYKRDLPHAKFHFLDGGHWILESHPAEVTGFVRDFLVRHF
jgi:pimeloyl-ACP methyl ester carboxylesterase